jgi:hypothetical protein
MNLRSIGAPATVLLFLFGISDARAAAGVFDDLKAGQALDVDGRMVGPKTIRATSIEVQRGTVRKQEVTGDIETIDVGGRTLSVLGMQVTASSNVIVEDQLDAPVEFSGLKVGRRIKVEGRLGDDGVFHADEIKLKDADPEVALEGPVEQVDGARKAITLVGFTVLVTPATKIKVEQR